MAPLTARQSGRSACAPTRPPAHPPCPGPTLAPHIQACGWRLRWSARRSRAAAWRHRCWLGRASGSSPSREPPTPGPSSRVRAALRCAALCCAVLCRAVLCIARRPGSPSPMDGLAHATCSLAPPAAVELGSSERMVAFCRAVQQCCPIGSYIQPVPGEGRATADPPPSPPASPCGSQRQRRALLLLPSLPGRPAGRCCRELCPCPACRRDPRLLR